MLKLILLVFVLFNSGFAWAETCGLFDPQGTPLPCKTERLKQANWKMVAEDRLGYFSAVGQLNQFNEKNERFGVCTGSFVTGSNALDAPVYVLSAGHCARSPKLLPGEFLVNAPTGEFSTLSVLGLTFSLGNVAYAIWDGWDIALYETTFKRSQLKEFNIRTFRIENHAVAAGSLVEFAGLSAATGPSLVESSCAIDAYAFGSEYQFRCSAAPGMSGSAVLSQKSGKVIGILDTSYGDFNAVSSTELLAGCFETTGVFNINAPTCKLPRPTSSASLCEAGNPRSCLRLGDLSKTAPATPERLAAAALFYQKGCELSDGKSCRQLAELNASQNKVDQAVSAFQKACAFGDPSACVNLGRAHEFGIVSGVSDPAKARELYRAACDRRFADGCYALGLLTERSEQDGDADEAAEFESQKLFAIACDFDVKAACAKLNATIKN